MIKFKDLSPAAASFVNRWSTYEIQTMHLADQAHIDMPGAREAAVFIESLYRHPGLIYKQTGVQ